MHREGIGFGCGVYRPPAGFGCGYRGHVDDGGLESVRLVILAAGLIGTGLVGYFHWRAKLRHQLLGESDERRAA
jgi:hypothetical protein